MSKPNSRSITSAGSESTYSQRQGPLEARGGRSSSNPASFTIDGTGYDTALPPIDFTHTPIAHRRTGSTLKTVMRKIFNRKRQSQADGLEESPYESYYPAAPARPTVPKTFLAIPTASDSKHSSPLSEKNLRLADTHLSPTSIAGGSLPSPGLSLRQRRASLPSVIHSDDGSRYAVASAVSDPESRAFTPEPQQSLFRSRRRSRSTDALRSLVDEQPPSPTAWRPRTASIPTTAPESKSSPRAEDSVAGQSGRRLSTVTTGTSVTQTSVPSIAESDQAAEQISLPPNVDNLVRTMQEDAGLTVEQRLNTLEVKMIDLEFAIARMQSSPTDTIPTPRSSRPKHTPFSDAATLHTRNKPSSGYLGSTERDESPSPLTHMPSGRPTSTGTIRPETMNVRTVRPAPSATSLSDFNGVSIEQYSTLVTLLRREQTARRNLETQVSTLRDDIRQIQRAAIQSMEMGTAYPIRSADSQEFLRLRRALDESDTSSPINTAEERPNGKSDNDSDWSPSERYAHDDAYAPSKWDSSQRIVPMI